MSSAPFKCRSRPAVCAGRAWRKLASPEGLAGASVGRIPLDRGNCDDDVGRLGDGGGRSGSEVGAGLLSVSVEKSR